MKNYVKQRNRLKWVQILATLISFILMGVLSGQLMAQGPIDKFKPGFSGYIQPAVGIGYSKSISDVSDDTKQIDSLNQDANSETTFFPLVLWELGYTLENSTTNFFAGTPKENIVEGTFFLEVGIQQKLSGGTILSASWIPERPVINNEVWKDPFLLGSERQETDQDSQAFKVTAESIGGSPVALRYGFGRQKIETEQSGSYLFQQPGSTLTATDLQMLHRNTDFHQLEALYGIPLGRGIMIRPGVTYVRGDADGDANSFNRFQGKVSFVYPWERWRFFGNFSLGWAEYDETNPVFNETREDVTYGTTLGLAYEAPFGWENFMATAFTSYRKQDANIKFYDSTSAIVSLGLAWQF
jgi:hypothetical protein